MEPWTYRCKVDRVIDGDTIDLMIDLGFHLTAKIRVRLLGVDTPEIRGPERPDGLHAKRIVEEWLHLAEDGTSLTNLMVRTRKTGKYGRWLADIWREHDDQSLCEMLVTQGWGDA